MDSLFLIKFEPPSSLAQYLNPIIRLSAVIIQRSVNKFRTKEVRYSLFKNFTTIRFRYRQTVRIDS